MSKLDIVVVVVSRNGKICDLIQSYLSIPSYQSLNEGHCLIVPMYHFTCGTLLDEDVWEEMKTYCHSLVQLFQNKNHDVVFFESAMSFNRYPHMVLNCVPVPMDVGNLAPMYFKKAIMECEKEWANNKKLVEIRRMDVKRFIPKGLPYIAVNFGCDKGFAHIIENEKEFPKYFAQEIIGGILDIDYSMWRHHRRDDFETQCKKVSAFKKWWQEYDSIKNQ